MLLLLALAACGAPDPCCLTEDGAAQGAPESCVASADDYPEALDCPANEGLAYLPPTQPNVMLVIDRSGSMGPHWASLLQLTPYIEGMGAMTRTGLTLFPGVGECALGGELAVPLAQDNGDAVLGALATTEPDGTTPMVETLQQLRESALLQDPGRDNVVILVADGQPDEGLDPDEEVRAWADLDVPVKMHFISFAGSPEADAIMNGMADATPLGFHYAASDITELAARLDRVAASLSPCGYALDNPVSAVDVSLDGVALDACTDTDCVEGYSYDADAGIVTLAPFTCRDAAVQDCPDVVIEAR
jgi:hypothetical protein